MQKIQIKRTYDPTSSDDGYRVLVDRLWPRGLSHEKFHYDLWEKALSPSTELREWFHEDPTKRWDEFVDRYKKELESNPDFETFKEKIADQPIVTLLYSSKDRDHNNAVVMEEELE
ncbi:MAG: DUF488 family protein [Bacteroidales bacterium]|nr:DUF488 family protein [Bacteroidales bacterium]